MAPAESDLRDKLIVALDVSSVTKARALAGALGESVTFYKIGFQLALAGGIDFSRELKKEGKKVFLDMKLLDIDNTVEKAVESAVGLGVDMLTVHAYPKAMHSAVMAARGTKLCLLAVTVLTSMDDADLQAAGYRQTAQALVARRAAQARDCGMGGLVCSPHEAAKVRAIAGPDMAIVTPGVRPADAGAGGQKRTATPRDAILAGATHLVVGRPVTESASPKAAAIAIIDDIRSATA